MRHTLCSFLIIMASASSAQSIFTYPTALEGTQVTGLHTYQLRDYTYAGGLLDHFDEATNTWDLSGGTFDSTEPLGITYFHGPSAVLQAQWPQADLFRLFYPAGVTYAYGEAYIERPDSVVYVGFFIIDGDTLPQSVWEDPVMITELPFAVDDTTVNTAATGSFTQTDTLYGLGQGVLITPLGAIPVASLVGHVDSELNYDAAFYTPTNCLTPVATWQNLGGSFRMTYYVPDGTELGVMEHTANGPVIYPNPTSGRITIAPKASFPSAQVFDGQGRCVASIGVCLGGCSTELDLPDGTYILLGTTATGALHREHLVICR